MGSLGEVTGRCDDTCVGALSFAPPCTRCGGDTCDTSMGETCSVFYMVEGERSTALSDEAMCLQCVDHDTHAEVLQAKGQCALLILRSVLRDLGHRYLRRWRTAAMLRKRVRYFERHTLLRFLVDSRQVLSHPSTLASHSTFAEPALTPTVGETQICWVPCDARDSYVFMLYPSKSRYSNTTSWIWDKMVDAASCLLITGRDLYDVPLGQPDGVLLYEIPFRSVSGMDYSNNITSDGRWSIETREVYKWWFPSEDVLGDFVHNRVAPQAVLMLAAATMAQAAYDAAHPLHHLRLLAEAAELPCAPGGAVPVGSTVAHRLPYLQMLRDSLSCDVSEEEAVVYEPVYRPPSDTAALVHTNMVVLYFGDDSAPELPFSLWKILRKPDNTEQLRLIESGLPSWSMFLSQRNIYYRTWIRRLVQTICIVWPIVTLVAALVDLYRSFETIRDLVSYVSSGALYAEETVFAVFGCIRALLWWLLQPAVESAWDALSDWWRNVVLAVLEDVSIVADFAGASVVYLYEVVTSIPLVSALAETKAYIVSMLLPYASELAQACITAAKLWMQVISNAWKIVSGSTIAVMRVVTSVARVPKWFGSTITGLFEGLHQIYSFCRSSWSHMGTVLARLMSLFSWRSSIDVTSTVNTTAETAVRWSMINSARQVIGNIIARTWNLTIFIGTEISKHWVTWVLRPFESLLGWLSDNRTAICKSIVALMPFGLLSYLIASYQHEMPANQVVVQDAVLYAVCWAATHQVYHLLSLTNLLYLCSLLLKPLIAASVAVVMWEVLLTQGYSESQDDVQQQCLVFSMILASGYVVVQALDTLLQRVAYARAAARATSPTVSPSSSSLSAGAGAMSATYGPSPNRLRGRAQARRHSAMCGDEVGGDFSDLDMLEEERGNSFSSAGSLGWADLGGDGEVSPFASPALTARRRTVTPKADVRTRSPLPGQEGAGTHLLANTSFGKPSVRRSATANLPSRRRHRSSPPTAMSHKGNREWVILSHPATCTPPGGLNKRS